MTSLKRDRSSLVNLLYLYKDGIFLLLDSGKGMKTERDAFCGFVEGVVLMPFVQKIAETLCKDFECVRCDFFFGVMVGACEAVRQPSETSWQNRFWLTITIWRSVKIQA